MDVKGATWRKSSYSTSNGGMCVEMADLKGQVGIRDSKNIKQGHLTVTKAGLAGLVQAIKSGKIA